MNEGEVSGAVQRAIASMQALVGRLLADDIDWAEFKIAVFKLMRETYYDTAAIAIGGGTLTQQERELIEQALAEQLYPHGEGFSLTEKMQEREDGLISLVMFVSSLRMYLQSAKSSAVDVWAKRNPGKLAVRTLGATDKHCPQCLLYSGLPAMSIEDIVIPGRQCNCYTNCLCSIQIIN